MGNEKASDPIHKATIIPRGRALGMVTKMAKNMVTKYGMSSELGTIAYGENEEEVFLGRSVTKQQNMSEDTARKIDAEVKKIVDKGYDRAKRVLTEKIDDL